METSIKNMDPENYYDEYGLKEWDRLEENLNHRLEFENTVAYLEEYLPEKGKVLDAGGGAGRYTAWLAQKGYEVTLIDISKKQVEIAKEKIEEFGLSNKVTVEKGDIRDLKFKPATFDAVLCTGGPLSHIMKEEERKQAVSELKRVAKPKAHIFISVIGKMAALFSVIEKHPEEIKILPDFLNTGNYTKELLQKYDLEPNFAETHFFRRDELKDLLENQNLTVKKIVGLEGFMTNKESVRTNKETVKKMCKKYREDPTIADMSNHILAIAKK